jgi:hypothetical protein
MKTATEISWPGYIPGESTSGKGGKSPMDKTSRRNQKRAK